MKEPGEIDSRVISYLLTELLLNIRIITECVVSKTVDPKNKNIESLLPLNRILKSLT